MMIQPMKLTPEIEQELRSRLRARALRADEVRRARLILMLGEGKSFAIIQKALGCNLSYITRWKQRFQEQGLAGLYARHQGRKVHKRTPKLEARILSWTRKPPLDGSTHWSSRKLARHLGVDHMMGTRLEPSRSEASPNRTLHDVGRSGV